MPADDPQDHWEDVYSDRSTDELTWYQEKPVISLELIERAGDRMDLDRVRVIDVGAGASTLEDYLADDPRYAVTALDIAPSALDRTRERLGPEAADRVDWVVADLTDPLEQLGPFDVWHDRAVLHFLTDPADRSTYLDNLERAVPPDGHAVLSTFSLDGPETCSGLPVRRYSPEMIADELGPNWQLLDERREDHPTPWGGTQNFMYAFLERTTR